MIGVPHLLFSVREKKGAVEKKKEEKKGAVEKKKEEKKGGEKRRREGLVKD